MFELGGLEGRKAVAEQRQVRLETAIESLWGYDLPQEWLGRGQNLLDQDPFQGMVGQMMNSLELELSPARTLFTMVTKNYVWAAWKGYPEQDWSAKMLVRGFDADPESVRDKFVGRLKRVADERRWLRIHGFTPEQAMAVYDLAQPYFIQNPLVALYIHAQSWSYQITGEPQRNIGLTSTFIHWCMDQFDKILDERTFGLAEITTKLGLAKEPYTEPGKGRVWQYWRQKRQV